MEAEHGLLLRLKNLGRVFFALSIIHFSLAGMIGSVAFYADAELRMHELGKAIKPSDKDVLSIDPPHEVRLTKVISTIIVELDAVLTLPLGPWYRSIPESPYALSTFRMPWFVALLNSLINGVILFILLLFLCRLLLGKEHPLREWLEGRGLRSSYSLVESASLSPGKPKVLQIAGQLKALEGFRYGPILIIAFFHLTVQQIHSFIIVGKRMGGDWQSFYHPILHFPTTPFIVESSFWNAYHEDVRVKSIMGIATALLWGIILVASYRFIRSRFKSK